MSSTKSLLKTKSEALMRLREEQVAVLAEQTDPAAPLEGDVALGFENRDVQIEKLMREQKTLRAQVDAERMAAEAADENFDGDTRGESARKTASLGELVKGVGPHDHVQIRLGDVGARKERLTNGAAKNRFSLKPTMFRLEDQADERTEEMPASSVQLVKSAPNGPMTSEVFALNTGTTGVGGSLPTLVTTPMADLFESVSMAQLCAIRSTGDGNLLKFSVRKKLADLGGLNDVSAFAGLGGTDAANTNANALLEALAAGNGFVAVGEGTAIPEAIQTFAEVELGKQKWGWITPVTHELTRDLDAWSIEQMLLEDAADLAGQSVSTLLTAGTGSGTTHTTPQGLRTEVIKAGNASRQVTSTGGTGDFNPTYADLVAMQHVINDGYARSASAAWLANWKTCGVIRRVRDDDNRPIFDMDPLGEFPGRILGKPIMVESSLPDIAASVVGTIIFGDFSKYVLRIVEGLRIDYSFEDGFRNDTKAWRFLMEFDGRLAIPEAFSALKSKAS